MHKKMATPIIGMKVAEASENDHRPGYDLLWTGTVMEVLADSDYEDDADVNKDAATYFIRFDDIDDGHDDEDDWDIEKILKANKLYNKLQELFIDQETQYLRERVASDGWFGTVVEYLGSGDWRIQFDEGNEEEENKRTKFNTVMVQEGIRFFRSLKEMHDPMRDNYYDY
jgi:hypothetical protein